MIFWKGGIIFLENIHSCNFVNIVQVEAWKMAKAGLLYTGQEEQVKCTFCGCLLSDWQYGDQVSLGYYTPPRCGGGAQWGISTVMGAFVTIFL